MPLKEPGIDVVVARFLSAFRVAEGLDLQPQAYWSGVVVEDATDSVCGCPADGDIKPLVDDRALHRSKIV